MRLPSPYGTAARPNHRIECGRVHVRPTRRETQPQSLPCSKEVTKSPTGSLADPIEQQLRKNRTHDFRIKSRFIDLEAIDLAEFAGARNRFAPGGNCWICRGLTAGTFIKATSTIGAQLLVCRSTIAFLITSPKVATARKLRSAAGRGRCSPSPRRGSTCPCIL